MNNPEPPIETLRGLLPKTADPRPGKKTEGESDFVPRYVERPRRTRNAAVTNIKWGVAALLLALVLLAAGVFVSGARALIPLFASLVTFTLLWIAARLRLFHQRHGVFFALGMVCLAASFVPLLERAWTSAANAAGGTGTTVIPTQVPTSGSAGDDEAPLLTKELSVAPADPGAGPYVRVLKDSRVLVGRKPYLIKTGDTFPLDELKDGDAIFFANELRLSLPEDAVDIVTPERPQRPTASAAPPPGSVSGANDRDTARSQQDAVRRYPALGVKDSPENRIFLETVRELREAKSELLDDPEWPLLIANLLAKREGWERKESVSE